jgi:carbon-monoxide dehydrogenase medium subunit
LAPFELAQPRSLREALALLDAEDVRPMSGGTALILMMKAGVLRPGRLVGLGAAGLAEIRTGAGGELVVGSMTTLAELERSPLVRNGWPVIARTLRTLSNVRVRNVATVGGHLAHADPHMDLPPLLGALGATVTVARKEGERTLPVMDIATGYLETSLQRGELITQLIVPALAGARAAYAKVTTRSADDWPAVGIAVVLRDSQARLVVSAATDRPTRLIAAERLLQGRLADEKAIAQAGEVAAEEARIESDLHGSAEYKKQLLRVYLARTIREARQ